MKRTYFVFSDVHGEYQSLLDALSEAGYQINDPNHVLVSLGDNFDRGPDSLEIFNLLAKTNAITILGNHEEMLLKAMREERVSGETLMNCACNGMIETLKSFTRGRGFRTDKDNFTVQEIEAMIESLHYLGYYPSNNGDIKLQDWLTRMPLYYETEHFIFVHAGFDNKKNKWSETDKKFMLWDIENSHRPVTNTNKIVVIGHNHVRDVKQAAIAEGLRTTQLYKSGPFTGIKKVVGCKDDNTPICIEGKKIAIDSNSNYTKKVNILVIEDNPKEAQSRNPEQDPSSYTTSWTPFTTSGIRVETGPTPTTVTWNVM